MTIEGLMILLALLIALICGVLLCTTHQARRQFTRRYNHKSSERRDHNAVLQPWTFPLAAPHVSHRSPALVATPAHVISLQVGSQFDSRFPIVKSVKKLLNLEEYSTLNRMPIARLLGGRRPYLIVGLVLTLLLVVLVACQPVAPTTSTGAAGGDTVPAKLVIYSGRNENLIGPLIAKFSEETGIEVEVRYGNTPELAATILEEGQNSPADVFFAQDAGSLGAVSKAGILAPLPADLLNDVPAYLRSDDGDWIGISGRARVLVYNVNELTEADLPDTIWGLTEETWRNRVGWAPTNASFHSFVTALRILEGEERAREWLEAMLANGVQPFPNNNTIVQAAASGEISVGLTNHYYLYRFLAEQGEGFGARNYYFRQPNAGSIINIAGVGILKTARNPESARIFVEYLLSRDAQEYFAQNTFEYPLIESDIVLPDILVPLAEIATPEIDLSDLADLEGTLTLLQEVGALE